MVSVVIPCRNEAEFIGPCLDGLLNNGYPLDRLEILVVDGRSDDGTRDVVERYAKDYGIIRIVDNPEKVTPLALNRGIAHAKGEFVMRVDGHTICSPDYIRNCLQGLLKHGADDVGGRWRIVASKKTAIGQAIAKALSSPIGVGNVWYRLAEGGEPREVDTVPFFFCRRELFDRVGRFNERLVRIQDMEFNNRLTRAGCRILLMPSAVSDYYSRATLKSFWRHNWKDGVWTVWAFADAEVMPIRWRHLVPAVFVASMMAGVFLALLHFPCFLIIMTVLYSLSVLSTSARIALAERDLRYLALIPLVVATMHLGRGLGSLCGMVKLLFHRRFGRAVRLLLNRSPAQGCLR